MNQMLKRFLNIYVKSEQGEKILYLILFFSKWLNLRTIIFIPSML